MIGARFYELAGRSAYQVLGVPETAGPEEINKGYRRRVRELHPDRGGDRDEAQSVSTAHRWLMRHRGDYDVFVSDQRRVDPTWGRVKPSVAEPSGSAGPVGPVGQEMVDEGWLAGSSASGSGLGPAPWAASGSSQRSDAEASRTGSHTGSIRLPRGSRPAPGTGALRINAPRTGSFRTVAQAQMAERAAEWADRQRGGEPRTSASFPATGQIAAADARSEMDPAGGARWQAGAASVEEQRWEASRRDVARRREERQRAEARRREQAEAREQGRARRLSGLGRESQAQVADGLREPVVSAGPAAPAGDEDLTPAQMDSVSDVALADRAARGDEAQQDFFSAGETGADSVPRPPLTGSFSPPPGSRKRSPGRRTRWIRWPRLGLPRLPRVGIPSAPRLGLPSLPAVGLPRVNVRVFSRGRRRGSIGLESVVLAALILVLGFLVATRIPY